MALVAEINRGPETRMYNSLAKFMQFAGANHAPFAIAFLILLSAIGDGRASAACTCDEAVLEERLASADDLIEKGRVVNSQMRGVMQSLGNLDRRGQLASSAVTEEVFETYETVFKQYEAALNSYKEHRRQYFQHVQNYHNVQEPEMISPTQSDSGVPQTNTGSGMQPLKYKVEDKCSELQNLERTIISNEQQLAEMVAGLVISQAKESAALFASAWAQANQLAGKNSTLASQFNHMGILKTAQVTSNVHELIMEANRDGAYNAHMQAYQDLTYSNLIEQEINKRASYHGQFAIKTMTQLAAMRPAGFAPQAPSPGGQPVVTSEQLQRESRELDQEYAVVQSLFQKLESARKSMPAFGNK